MTTTLTKTAFFDASRETVWSFLTDKDKLGTWYHPAEKDLTLGQPYTLYRMSDDGARVPQITGEVLEMDPPSRLVTTFVIGPFGDKATTVTWVLEDAADGTRLHLTHEGIAEAAEESALRLLMAIDDGWDEHFASLRKAVAVT